MCSSDLGFLASEDQVPGRDRVVVLGHDFWLAHFNGSRSVVGEKIRLDGIDFTVVGVAPKTFTGMDSVVKDAFFVPAAMAPLLTGEDTLNKRDARNWTVKGRLKTGVTNATAAADLNAIESALEKMYPTEPRGMKIRVESELQMRLEQSPPDTALVEMLMADRKSVV